LCLMVQDMTCLRLRSSVCTPAARVAPSGGFISTPHVQSVAMSSATAPPGLSAALTGTALRRRAERIRRLGEYAGLFEWLVWATLNQCEVLVHMNVDILSVLDLMQPRPELPPGRAQHHVALCRLGDDGALLTSTAASANHWVVLLPLPLPHESVREAPPPAIPGESLIDFEMARGWLVDHTVADGNCAFDAMAALSSQERQIWTWKTLRQRVAEFIDAHAMDSAWHNAFFLCGELDVYVCACKRRTCSAASHAGRPVCLHAVLDVHALCRSCRVVAFGYSLRRRAWSGDWRPGTPGCPSGVPSRPGCRGVARGVFGRPFCAAQAVGPWRHGVALCCSRLGYWLPSVGWRFQRSGCAVLESKDAASRRGRLQRTFGLRETPALLC